MKKLSLAFALSAICFLCNAQLAWLRLPDYPGTGKVGTNAFSIGGKGYMGLGFDSLIHGTSDWWEYDPGSNAWTQKASLPSAGRWGSVYFVINNKGYVATGYKGFLTTEVWEYDPASNQWSAKASFPGSARENAAGFSIGSKGYLGTGYASNNSFTDFYEFDPVANSWTQKAPFAGTARNTAAGFSIGNKGYIGMGTATGSISNYNDVFEYDPGTNSWSQKADFPITYIDAPCSYSGNGSAYILCGYYYQLSGITHNPLNTLYKYDQANDVWSLEGTFRGLPRGYAGGFAIANDMYIGCGGESNDGDPDLMIRDFWKLSNGMLLSIINPTGGTDVALYPNPASNFINVGGDPSQIIKSVRIYNSAGSQVMVSDIRKNERALDITSLRSGMYFVELITNKNEVLNSRFVKE